MWRQIIAGSIVMTLAIALHITILVSAIELLPDLADQLISIYDKVFDSG